MAKLQADWQAGGSNRTFMELKLQGTPTNKKAKYVLIAPLWN